MYISISLYHFVSHIFGVKKGDLKKLYAKTNRVVKQEKIKRERIAKREAEKLKRDTLKQERINERKRLLKEKKEAKLAKIEEKRRLKLERKARRKKSSLFSKKVNSKSNVKPKKISERKRLKEQAKLAKMETQLQARLAKEKREEEVLKKSLESNKKDKKKKNKSESITINKLTFADKMNNFVKNIKAIPSNIEKAILDKWENTSFARNRKNKLDLNRKALLVEFSGKDAERSDVKIMYEYVVKDQDGKIIKGHADGFSKVEIHSYLLSEGYEVYSIKTNKWIQLLYGSTGTNKVKIKTKDLIFFVTQLSTYLKSGITLVESLKILSRQYKKKSYKKTIF